MTDYPDFDRELRGYFKMAPGVLRGVSIKVDDDACAACKADLGKVFTRASKVTHLPHKGCTCKPYGCRCCLMPELL